MIRKTIAVLSILLLFICEARAQALITPGVPVTSNTSLTVANGTAFAIPQGRGVIITWQTSFAVAPTSITVQLQFSLDNTSYFMVDSSSNTAGELKYLGPISARFVRCAVTAVNAGAGSGFQCKINVLGFNNATAFSGGTFSSDITLASGTQVLGAAADNCIAGSIPFSFVGDTDTGLCSPGVNSLTLYVGGGARYWMNAADWVYSSSGSFGFSTASDPQLTAPDTRFRRTGNKTVTFDDGAGGAAIFTSVGGLQSDAYIAITGKLTLDDTAASGGIIISNWAGTRSVTLQAIDVPTCTTNCGTTPTVVGVSSSFTLTMGTTPASGFQVNFPTAWVAAPQCVGSMALAGMVIGKLPLTYATTTTTLTIVTNGTAPSTGDKYHFICSLGQ